MTCEYGYNDCENFDAKCHLCSNANLYLEPKKKQYKKPAPKSKRAGSEFEARNHNRTQQLLISSTPNSGAGSVKGDEEIKGIIEVMEELKCSNKTSSKGEKNISIQKAWLQKLEKEAKFSNKEFWYLKFCYGNDDKETFVVVGEDIIMSMLKTMIEDRKTKNTEMERSNVLRNLLAQKNAEIDTLKSQLKFLEEKHNDKFEFDF